MDCPRDLDVISHSLESWRTFNSLNADVIPTLETSPHHQLSFRPLQCLLRPYAK